MHPNKHAQYIDTNRDLTVNVIVTSITYYTLMEVEVHNTRNNSCISNSALSDGARISNNRKFQSDPCIIVNIFSRTDINRTGLFWWFTRVSRNFPTTKLFSMKFSPHHVVLSTHAQIWTGDSFSLLVPH